MSEQNDPGPGNPYKKIDQYGQWASPYVRRFCEIQAANIEVQMAHNDQELHEATLNGDAREIERFTNRDRSLKLELQRLQPPVEETQE